jgi:predicted transcriptional regulator of viral defense system
MLAHEALRIVLIDCNEPVVTGYKLFVRLAGLYRQRKFQGEDLELKRACPNRYDYRRVVSLLVKQRYLQPDMDFFGRITPSTTPEMMAHSPVFRVIDVPDGVAEDITALVDPFCYVSHLSAMQRYGLTNRSPEALTLSTPAAWKDAALARMRSDYGDIGAPGQYRFPLSRIEWPEIVRRRAIAFHKTNRTPLLRDIRDSFARIAAVGETFVQTLDRPELCGGMDHVVEVWEEHAKTYLREIIPAVERAPEKIIKVRAGYLLDERLGIHDARIDSWTQYAQSGGSQRLDPTKPFINSRSEKWMISLNV